MRKSYFFMLLASASMLAGSLACSEDENDPVNPPTVAIDTTLSSLTVSSGTLTPAFAPAQRSYTVSVANSVTSVDLAATATDAANGAYVQAADLGTKSLAEGDNLFAIRVVAADSTTTGTYTVSVNRASGSVAIDTTLSSLTVSSGTLTPAFSPAQRSYTVNVANSVTSIELAATAASGATVQAADLGTKTLAVGDNTFTIRVVAADGTTTGTYTVNVHRASGNGGGGEAPTAPTNARTSDVIEITTVDGKTQWWTSEINLPACNKTDYDAGGGEEPLKADCRNSPDDAYGYFYSWEYVQANKSTLCPDGWAVPTNEDFVTLDIALGGNGTADQTTAALLTAYEEKWGAIPGGRAQAEGVEYQGTDGGACYYASSTDDAITNGYVLFWISGGRVNPARQFEKWYAFPVRCVQY